MSALITRKLRIPNIVLFGAPGVGKGTYGTILEKDLNFKKISTGDQIRALLKTADLSYEMEEIKKVCQSGSLVDDSMVLEIIINSVKDLSSFNGILFDGFPRNTNQLDLFAERFDTDYSFVVNCILEESILVEKLAGRRVCDGCGANYNVCSINRDGYSMKPLMPKHGGNCDCCGGKLVQREDDKEHTVRHRLGVYKLETEPLLRRFENLGIRVLHFEPKKGIEDYPELMEGLMSEYLPSVGLGGKMRVAASI